MASWHTPLPFQGAQGVQGVLAPLPFHPVQYIPASSRDETRAKEVSLVRAVAHAQIPGPYQCGRTNHWCLYLQTGPSESVCLDISPAGTSGTVLPGGIKAVVSLSQRDDTVPKDVERTSEVTTAQGLTVGDIVDLLLQEGRERYEFTPEGVGCRKWTIDTLNLLALARWLDQTEVSAAITDIGMLWPDATPLELEIGQYYWR